MNVLSPSNDLPHTKNMRFHEYSFLIPPLTGRTLREMHSKGNAASAENTHAMNGEATSGKTDR